MLPEEGAVMLPSLFLGTITSIYPLDWLARNRLGERYAEYCAYSRKKVRGATGRLLIGFCIVIPLLSGLYMVGLHDTWTRCTEEGIEINRVWTWGSTWYPIDDIDRVTTSRFVEAPNGRLVERETGAVVFGDGSVWRFDEYALVTEPAGRTLHEIVEFVSMNAGVDIQRVEVSP